MKGLVYNYLHRVDGPLAIVQMNFAKTKEKVDKSVSHVSIGGYGNG